jgi:hypothetical protein
MSKANRVKFYLARYFFLALGCMQALASLLLLIQIGDSPKTRFAAFVFFTLAMILFSIHWMVSGKIKRVAFNKKKIYIVNAKKTKHYDWNEVKDLKHIAFLNIYSMKLKGKRKKIYFLPPTNGETLFGLFGGNLQLANKK